MSELGVNKLFNLSKQAKSNKEYDLEKEYLMQAISLSPSNIKIINAIIRNLRKTGDNLELKKWLELLYSLNPNGKTLYELIKIEQGLGNLKRVKELLLENERLNPNSKKIKKRLKKIEEKEQACTISNSLLVLEKDDVDLVRKARDIIYSEDDLSSKYNQIIEILESQSEEVTICVLVEFYNSSLNNYSARKLIKEYKEKLDLVVDSKKIKLLKILLELISSKKVSRINWNEFWIKNSVILFEKGKNKVLVKKSYEVWQGII